MQDRKLQSFRPQILTVALIKGLVLVILSSSAFGEEAFRIGKKSYSTSELRDLDQAGWYEVDKQKYALVESLAHQEYLEYYWQNLAKEQKVTPDVAREKYFERNARVSADEFKQTMDQFRDHPQLARFPMNERERQVRAYLEQSKMETAIAEIISAAKATGDLRISLAEPQEPIFKIALNDGDPVRYGPNPDDTKPQGCSGEACPITVVEYSEFQCVFCARVLPTARRLMTEYQGKVRWVVRDWPLALNDRAGPAAIAAHCAGKQGKYWDMYFRLFENQAALGDEDFKRHARQLKGLDAEKWSDCTANSTVVRDRIDNNFASGQRFGVGGTPTFFINGRRLSGALPFEEFKRVFDEELAKNDKI